MKQYTFLTEAFISNYWMNTTGEFNLLWTDNNVINLINKAKKLNYIPHYKSKSSYYLISPDKTKLIRISDHWSKTNINGLKSCGNVGSCFWILTSNKKVNIQKYQAGICDMIKLRKI